MLPKAALLGESFRELPAKHPGSTDDQNVHKTLLWPNLIQAWSNLHSELEVSSSQTAQWPNTGHLTNWASLLPSAKRVNG